ncbi:ATP-grasp fold subdomain 1 [Penicillium concentricum]|uniref:ATP-grasp fold subdomain 1 n=1 Tax=Penicillium concentricum TaxID=293559 RepID=A0A9W9SSK9_9EURO|nr:ATP-grasp fold subdomain 1 [Penicillium concentricum]KAJ5383810.1 ATP-grasp fold subdomain 1 [Penicillium concentricum]
MKICVFQSCFEELQASVGESQKLHMNPGQHITQHKISHNTIHKATAKAQIDVAVSEGHDFYLNFMWGTHDDSLAGIDAIRYFESLNLPSAGIQSSEREQSKWDFFAEAKRAGSPLIPGTTNFPLFVKPASSYGSMFIDEHSLCQNEEELDRCIQRLNKLMRSVRVLRAQALGYADPDQYADAREAEGRDSSDLVVQEFIDGEEYSVVVIAMGKNPFPLIPQRAKYKKLSGEGRFLTLDLKFDEASGYELLNENDDPRLWEHLQATAIEAFTTNKMYTNYMGCDVDMRIGRDGRAYVIEVDPLPVFFYPIGSQLEDTDIQRGFPGSYRAVVNTYITNYFLEHPGKRGDHFIQVANFYDSLAQSYAGRVSKTDTASHVMTRSYQGTALDLGCGPGTVGYYLKSHAENKITEMVGVDISKKSLNICHHNNLYTELVHKRMEVYLAERTQMVDHIFCMSALQHLSMEELDFVLARCFQLAKQSITLMIGAIGVGPDSPLDQMDETKAFLTDHSESLRTFKIPHGWSALPICCPDSQDLHFRFQRKG